MLPLPHLATQLKNKGPSKRSFIYRRSSPEEKKKKGKYYT